MNGGGDSRVLMLLLVAVKAVGNVMEIQAVSYIKHMVTA